MLGQEHLDTLISMANWVSIYCSQERWKEAEDLELLVIEIRKKVLGQEHPETLIIMNNSAWTWKKQAQHDKSLQLMATCVELREKILGKDLPVTVTSRATLYEWQEEQKISR